MLPQVKVGDIYLGGEGLPNENESIGNDFALLANCNHTIESHGSFSYLAGAFAGGFKIKPKHFPKVGCVSSPRQNMQVPVCPLFSP